jgi:UDP-GlcNAc:undecaprenyl-phosphate GlcNAc-1-phosphate transferase
MSHNWPYVVALLVAWLSTDLLIPHVVRLAKHIGKMDEPDARKVHTEPIPRLGGIAIFLGFILSLYSIELLQPGFFSQSVSWHGIVGGGSLMFLLGVADDLKPLPAKFKFVCQILIAIIAFWLGVKINVLSNPFGGMIILPYWFAVFGTVFWLVGITNTINLIDGLDGLAAGITTIAGITLSIIALKTNQVFGAVIILSLVGGTIGFLRYNFNPAKIFMGDSGSLFLGFTLAAISITGVLKLAATVTILLPLLILGFPIIDTTFAIIRRAVNGKPIFQPDKGHLHHRLLGFGLSQRRVVVVIYGFSSLLAGIALYLVGSDSALSIIIVSVIMLCLGFLDFQRLKEMVIKDSSKN